MTNSRKWWPITPPSEGKHIICPRNLAFFHLCSGTCYQIRSFLLRISSWLHSSGTASKEMATLLYQTVVLWTKFSVREVEEGDVFVVPAVQGPGPLPATSTSPAAALIPLLRLHEWSRNLVIFPQDCFHLLLLRLLTAQHAGGLTYHWKAVKCWQDLSEASRGNFENLEPLIPSWFLLVLECVKLNWTFWNTLRDYCRLV